MGTTSVFCRGHAPALQNFIKFPGDDRFGDVAVHSGVETTIPVAAMAWAVMTIVGRCLRLDFSRARMAAVDSKPSISGIWTSMKAISKQCNVAATSASLPLSAEVTT